MPKSIYTLRLDDGLRTQLEFIAREQGRSLANLIQHTLRQSVYDSGHFPKPRSGWLDADGKPPAEIQDRLDTLEALKKQKGQ